MPKARTLKRRRAPSGPRVTTPTQVAGLVLWLDASRADSLTVDESNRVAAWADLSGAGNSPTQSANNRKPTLAASYANGLDALRFQSGGPQYIERDAALFTATPFSLFAVFSTTSITSTATLVWIGDKDSNNEYWRLWRNAAQVQGGANWYPAAGNATVSGLSADTVHLASHVVAGDSSRRVWLDGQAGAEETTTAAPTDTADRFSIGRDGQPADTGHFDGYVCEVLAFNVALSDTQRAAIESYLALKWGATLA